MSEKRRSIAISAVNENDGAKKPDSYASKFNPKNYLNVKLAPGEDVKKLRIRTLTFDKDSNVVFKEAHMHTVMLNEEQIKAFTPANGKPSKWKSYICLEKEPDVDHEVYGKNCPFCETQRDAYKLKEEAEKAAKANGINPKDDTDVLRYQRISLNNKMNPVWMCRCIERGDEDSGPKFWKMTQDAYAQIRAIEKARREESIEEAMEENNGVLPEGFVPVNIYDIYEGRDLQITITRKYDEKTGKPLDKTDIKITDITKPKPLSTDEDKIDEWLDDEKKWTDVFVIKRYDYLSLIVEGEVPFYDKENDKWIPRKKKSANVEEQENISEKYDEKIREAESKYTEVPVEDEVEDDIPF